MNCSNHSHKNTGKRSKKGFFIHVILLLGLCLNCERRSGVTVAHVVTYMKLSANRNGTSTIPRRREFFFEAETLLELLTCFLPNRAKVGTLVEYV